MLVCYFISWDIPVQISHVLLVVPPAICSVQHIPISGIQENWRVSEGYTFMGIQEWWWNKRKLFWIMNWRWNLSDPQYHIESKTGETVNNLKALYNSEANKIVKHARKEKSIKESHYYHGIIRYKTYRGWVPDNQQSLEPS